MANHGPSFGLSRELQRKNQARFDIEEAKEVLSWIADNVTEVELPRTINEFETDQHVSEALKDGKVLCTLMSKLYGPIKYNRKACMPFQKMENISIFLDKAKEYGVPEISCFQTVDLYENKQPYKVVECLRALAAVAQSKNAPCTFPPWVVKIAEGRPRNFAADVIRQGEAVIGLQYGTNKMASQSGMNFGLGRQINPTHH